MKKLKTKKLDMKNNSKYVNKYSFYYGYLF